MFSGTPIERAVLYDGLLGDLWVSQPMRFSSSRLWFVDEMVMYRNNICPVQHTMTAKLHCLDAVDVLTSIWD